MRERAVVPMVQIQRERKGSPFLDANAMRDVMTELRQEMVGTGQLTTEARDALSEALVHAVRLGLRQADAKEIVNDYDLEPEG